MLTQVSKCSERFFFLRFSEELSSNIRAAGQGWQKKPIQQKILKSRNTNPPHYRQTSLASRGALACNTDDCAVSPPASVCVISFL